MLCLAYAVRKQELLESNLGNCKSNITTTDDDLGLIKDNLTTLEVRSLGLGFRVQSLIQLDQGTGLKVRIKAGPGKVDL